MIKNKYFFATAAFWLSFAGFGIAQAQDLSNLLPEDYRKAGFVSVGSQQTVPPIEFRDPQTLVLQGAGVDLLMEAGKRLGVEIRYAQAEYSALIPGIEAKRFDIASGAISDTEEREEKLDFINYMIAGASILIHAEDNDKYKTLVDFCGKTMATLLGSRVIMGEVEKVSEQCVADGKGAIEVEQLPSAPDARQQLDLRRVDGYLGDFPALVYMRQQIPDKYEIVGGNYKVVNYITSYGFAKDRTDLRDAFKAALDAMKADGTYDTIMARWDLSGVALTELTLNLPANKR